MELLYICSYPMPHLIFLYCYAIGIFPILTLRVNSELFIVCPLLAKEAETETGKETQRQKGQVCASQAGGGKKVGEGRLAADVLSAR